MIDSSVLLIKQYVTGSTGRDTSNTVAKTKVGIKEVSDSDLTSDDSGEEFLGTVNADTVSTNRPWTAVVQHNKRTQEFKVETGQCYYDS
jgi:hypothetical protein